MDRTLLFLPLLNGCDVRVTLEYIGSPQTITYPKRISSETHTLNLEWNQKVRTIEVTDQNGTKHILETQILPSPVNGVIVKYGIYSNLKFPPSFQVLAYEMIDVKLMLSKWRKSVKDNHLDSAIKTKEIEFSIIPFNPNN